jgi:hypothetical protein
MKRRGNSFCSTKPRKIAAALLLASLAGSVTAAENDGAEPTFTMGGYLRGSASFNLQNPPETAQNDKYDLSMLRGSLLLDADAKLGAGIKLKAIARLDREAKTGYMKRLDNLPGQAGNLMDEYNNADMRELYVDFPVGDRVNFRLGKQQVVWGETDFFRALDVVHGFDYRWRSFLEVENEELRKPLILGNMRIQVPEANGSLQAIVRPGWDRGKDIGNTYDLSGGRWANQPNKGVNFFGPSPVPGMNLTNYDYDHPDGNIKDVTGGMRWAGEAAGLNYSVAYMKTFNNDPVVNPSALIGGTPYKVAPKGLLGDFIYPKIDVLGATASGYSEALDAVLSTEIVYNKDVPFNYGSNFGGGFLPGFAGVTLKNTLVTMFRIDKQVNLSPLIGTSRPSFFSVQLFNTRVLDFNQKDDIVFLAGYGAPRKRDSTMLTMILAMNYDNDRINPAIAAGWDASYGGGFVIPSVEFVMGDKWRLKAEANLFFNGGRNKQPGQVENKTALMGYFANNNQLAFRLTRQF